MVGEFLNAIVSWETFLVALLVFGFAPGAALRLIVLAFHRNDPRRGEMLAELHRVPRWERPFWVFEQLEVALSEGIWERVALASGRIIYRWHLLFGVQQYAKPVERHAMQAALNHYRAKGWTVEDVSAFCPYDLHCKQGNHVLHVEVKGTTSAGKRVLLTRNEVAHAQAKYPDTALFILADVRVVKKGGRHPSARGGRAVIVEPWIPER